MQTTTRRLPSTKSAFKALLRADMIVQWRQRRAVIMSIIVPVIFVISWRSLIPTIGGAAVLAICTAIGLPASGLMGYSMTIARDRERGVFQRLRTAPISTWIIMISRIIVQLIVILVMTILTYAVARYVDNISISLGSFLLLLAAALIGGLSFVALGQLVVSFIRSSEAVNAAVRLIYFPLAIVGAIGEIGIFGALVQKIVAWSPLGTTESILLAAINPGGASIHDLWALLVTIGYGVVFAGIGIKWFKWN
jgi:ABC-2 type transport system permease protein